MTRGWGRGGAGRGTGCAGDLTGDVAGRGMGGTCRTPLSLSTRAYIHTGRARGGGTCRTPLSLLLEHACIREGDGGGRGEVPDAVGVVLECPGEVGRADGGPEVALYIYICMYVCMYVCVCVYVHVDMAT